MDCFNRDKESERFWALFNKGKNILMLAPRRIGKTVLLNRLKEESEPNGYHAIVLDIQGYREEKAFFRQMCAAIQEEIGIGQTIISSFTDRLKRVAAGNDISDDWRKILLNTEWDTFADHLLAQLEACKDQKPWLFLVDEIPIFIRALIETEGAARAHDFLYMLRNLCLKYKKIRWLYTGSIGLDTIARRNGIEGALVDMEVETLEPFDRETAGRFLAHIAGKSCCTFERAAIEKIIARLGWLSPYYLEKIGEAACDGRREGETITADDAEKAINSLLELSHRIYFSTWREHLDKNFAEPERTHLFSLLYEISRPDGAQTDSLLQALNKGGPPVSETILREYLDTLEADGYLSADSDRSRFHFRMNLLREWWVRYVTPKSFPERDNG